MKILLLKPPFNPHLITTTIYEPLELEYLAAAVSEHRVKILDMRLDKNLVKTLHAFKPDVACITAYSCDIKTAKRILKEIKKFDNSIQTVVGGIHATFMPSDFEEHYIDTIFIGYADLSFKNYICKLEEGEGVESISNLGIRKNNQFIYTEKQPFDVDLNSIPLPARHLVRDYQNKYHDSYRNTMSMIMTSRGCPFRCTFCACWKLMNGKYVTRDIKSIIEEIKSLPDEIKVIYFSDDNTLVNAKRAWELSEMLKENKIDKSIQMYARANTIVKHPDLFRSLKESGLEYLTVGIESFKDEELVRLNKKSTVNMNNEAIRILKELGINILAHFIVFPDYDEEDFDQLYRYVEEKNLFKPAFPVLTPLPGTELFAQTLNQILIRDYDFYDFAHSVLPTRLSRKEFYRQLTNLYKKSYSIKRYLKYKISQKFSTKKNNVYSGNLDGITLFNLLLIRIFARPQIWKLKNAYKTEILSQDA
ncbi:B12-binding domain-containing radical SAM protein [Bacteroidota bacterium]